LLTVATATPADIWPDGCPHPPAMREEIMRVARHEVTSQDVAASRLGFSPWYIPYFIAEERVLARAQQARSLQAQEISLLKAGNQTLTQRVAQLERRLKRELGPGGTLLDGMAQVVGKTLAKLGHELRAEIAAVADRQLKFMGVHESGRSYQPNSLVVRSGGLWCALEATAGTPGQSSHWQLVTKSGDFAKSGATSR
jgi:hypothetical protein